MKVRIGYGLGVQGLRDDTSFGELVDGLEERGFDSLWLSERLTGDAPDPMVGLAYAAGRTRKLKLGTSVQVLPGRNPAVVAKEWASLDRLSGGRTLPAFGLGVANPAEQQAFGVARDERAAWFDEALPLVRRLWTEDAVDHDGPRYSYRALSVRPKPVQQPPDVWLGGRAKSELRRVGRLGDGWLPSFSTPAEVAAGRVVVEEAAADAGREIEDEHYGALVIYVRDAIPELLASGIKAAGPTSSRTSSSRSACPRCGRASSSSSSTASRSWSSCPRTIPGHGPPSSTTPHARSSRCRHNRARSARRRPVSRCYGRGICWTAQPLPSGSLKKTNDPQGKCWTSLTSTPRSTSSARAVSMSDTTIWRPCTEPGGMSVMPVPIAIEAGEPGGVSCTKRSSSLTWWSWSALKPARSV